jgi:metallo-beta-lactamase family protein
MKVTFLGAAQTVTGSMHLVTTQRASVLLDCGLFQGPRREAARRNRELPFDASSVDAVVLSHAHIDHSGALPMLGKSGFRGSVYTTPATRDLAAVMLEDAALIQASDAKHVNKLIDRGELDGDHVEPPYTVDDVVALLGTMVSVPYHRATTIAPGVTLTFFDAGHVLGSAIVVLDVEEDGATKRLVFSGDLGRKGMPILRDPEVPPGAHALLLESTYGDRVHPPRAAMDDALGDLVTRVIGRGGKVIVPTFALERAQEIVLSLRGLAARHRLPDVPIYVDSPLTVKVTEVFRMHPECYDADVRAAFERGESPFDLPRLRYVSKVEDSKEITASDGPAIILAASGMCESGRVLHHLRGAIGDPRCAIAIVGFQAPHTLGRRLVERREEVRIFGLPYTRRCEIATLNGFSAHAGQDELVAFATAVRARGTLGPVALVHGEPPAQHVLAALLARDGLADVRTPAPKDTMTI